MTEEAFDQVIAINLRGVFLGMKYVIPHMVKAGGGSIVNQASIAGLIGIPGGADYAAAKAGVIAMTRVAAVEIRPLQHPCELHLSGRDRNPDGGADPQGARTKERAIKRISVLERMGRARGDRADGPVPGQRRRLVRHRRSVRSRRRLDDIVNDQRVFTNWSLQIDDLTFVVP